MVESAPRYDPRILEAVRALDDRGEPMAEIARRVGRVAAEFGLPKPSYVHLRRYLIEHHNIPRLADRLLEAFGSSVLDAGDRKVEEGDLHGRRQ